MDVKRAAPMPPIKTSSGSRILAERPPPAPPGRSGSEMGRPPRAHQPPGGQKSPSLDRSASHRTPPTHPPKQKGLDRANTTRAPGSKTSPPQAFLLAKSQSQEGHQQRARADPGLPPAGTAAAGLARQHTAGKGQHGATPRRRDKTKENEEVIRQLQAICSPGDPNHVYRSLQKIGQG